MSRLLADNPLVSREETGLFDNANHAAAIERTVMVGGAPTTETLSPRYDELGNLISDGQDKSYVYDDFGRLSEVWVAGELEDRLWYDAAGRLSEDSLGPTGQTRTVEMAGLLPVAFSGPAGLRRMVPNPDTGMALAIMDPSGVEPYELPTSALGVTRLLSTATGAVADAPVRSPYGEVFSADPSAYPFGFKGSTTSTSAAASTRRTRVATCRAAVLPQSGPTCWQPVRSGDDEPPAVVCRRPDRDDRRAELEGFRQPPRKPRILDTTVSSSFTLVGLFSTNTRYRPLGVLSMRT